MHRAYSLITTKDFDSAKRVFAGIATSPEPDRVGDVIEPSGVRFKNPMPLLLGHDSHKPVGEARFGKATKDGIAFTARISTIERETGIVRERLDEAVDSLNADPPLIRGVSIGFRPLVDPVYIKETGGFLFPEIEVMELSMVVIPAHQSATIAVLKSLDIGAPKSGTVSDRPESSAGVTALSPRRRVPAMNTSERITTLQAERKKTAERMTAIYQPVQDGTGDLTTENRKEFDGLKATLADTDTTISDLLSLEQAMIAPKAMPVRGATAEEAADSRRPRFAADEGRAKSVCPPEMEFVRHFICKAAARIYGMSPLDVARERYPDNPRIQSMLKAAVAGATTTDSTWASPLLQDVRTVTSAFLDYLRPRTIIGRFGEGGIPSLNRVGFYERVQSQTTGGSSGWTGEGIQKPVTKFDFDAFTTVPMKATAISVMSDELVRFSTPSAEGRVRDALTKIIVERLDRDFIDPDKALVSNTSPASITSGITGLTPSSGGDPDDVRTDVAALMGSFIGTNQNVENLVWIMSGTSAMQLMLMRNALGNREFPNISVKGGEFEGFPVIVSQYAAVVGSPTQNVVILMNPSEIFLADDGQVTVDMSTEATIEMSDDPANEVGTQVNMYQTNQVALRAERHIYWKRGRTSSVAWLDGAAWSAAA